MTGPQDLPLAERVAQLEQEMARHRALALALMAMVRETCESAGYPVTPSLRLVETS